MAEKEFDAVQQMDPYRMEEVDIYSNMLYVMEKKAKLGKLAHEYAEIDRNRAEVCCLIGMSNPVSVLASPIYPSSKTDDHRPGNYYSSRADHTKAITYFKRSLMLNRDYLPAWTLMGHEFVELKNSHAAIEAYRKAIGTCRSLRAQLTSATDVNAKDYRAWYGLGQAYELLDMPNYAIEYYNQATALRCARLLSRRLPRDPELMMLRPYDCRMWTALGTVYESLQRWVMLVRDTAMLVLPADAKRQATRSMPGSHARSARCRPRTNTQHSLETRISAHGDRPSGRSARIARGNRLSPQIAGAGGAGRSSNRRSRSELHGDCRV